MTMTFRTSADITAALAFDLNDFVRNVDWGDMEVTAEFHASARSISAYSEISFFDAEGDHVRSIKVRFSDHADRYGSDMTVRIEDHITVVEDDGEYIETAIENSAYEALLASAIEYVMAA